MTTEEQKMEKLTGSENYLGWSKVIIQKLYAKNLVQKNSIAPEAMVIIMSNISLKIAANVPDEEGPNAVWNYLKLEYGNQDYHAILRELKTIKMTGIDLDSYFDKLNTSMSQYKAAGGKINFEDIIDTIVSNIHEFYVLKKCHSGSRFLEL